jgi:hypothetical protein
MINILQEGESKVLYGSWASLGSLQGAHPPKVDVQNIPRSADSLALNIMFKRWMYREYLGQLIL